MSKLNTMKHLFFNLLSPLTWIWDYIYRFRRFCYSYGLFQQEYFKVPLISIGNLTFGGTGKTPFTLWLSELFESQQKNVMILTRGYRGELEKKTGVLPAERRLGFNPLKFGDEAALLARRLKKATIVVGSRRAKNLEYYFEDFNPDVVILDDGHQHLNLGRDLNIVLFDALLPLERYRVAPLGYMRENFQALRDTSVIVIGRADQVKREKIEQLKEMLRPHASRDVVFVEIAYKATGFFSPEYQKVYDIDQIKGQKIICLAGIASPRSFFKMLSSYGAEVIEEVSYPDHHIFEHQDLVPLIQKAEKEGAYIVTTEKDIVKMRRVTDSDRVIYLEIQVEVLSGEQALREIISQICEFSPNR